MMARCLNSEKNGRTVFYGAMIAEGIIALVWAAAGVSCYESSRALMDAGALAFFGLFLKKGKVVNYVTIEEETWHQVLFITRLQASF